ncbi:MAG: helix-turn-helix domain-containing protein [Actinomycetota bacterium]
MQPRAYEYGADEAFLTTGEVARALKVSPKTVARWATDGKLPHIVTLGGHRRFPSSAIDELAERLVTV